MSETSAQEPTMEEILASIRRIISEDDAPPAEASQADAATTPHASAEPSPPAVAAPSLGGPTEPAEAEPPKAEPFKIETHAAPPPAPEEDVLELTEPVDPPPATSSRFEGSVGDLDVFSPGESFASPRSTPSSAPFAPAYPEEPLIGSYAAEQSAGHFGALARTLTMPKEGRTLEDLVREMLRPMLRDWLDHHLPGIVEARVQAEVERISRRGDF